MNVKTCYDDCMHLSCLNPIFTIIVMANVGNTNPIEMHKIYHNYSHNNEGFVSRKSNSSVYHKYSGNRLITKLSNLYSEDQLGRTVLRAIANQKKLIFTAHFQEPQLAKCKETSWLSHHQYVNILYEYLTVMYLISLHHNHWVEAFEHTNSTNSLFTWYSNLTKELAMMILVNILSYGRNEYKLNADSIHKIESISYRNRMQLFKQAIHHAFDAPENGKELSHMSHIRTFSHVSLIDKFIYTSMLQKNCMLVQDIHVLSKCKKIYERKTNRSNKSTFKQLVNTDEKLVRQRRQTHPPLQPPLHLLTHSPRVHQPIPPPAQQDIPPQRYHPYPAHIQAPQPRFRAHNPLLYQNVHNPNQPNLPHRLLPVWMQQPPPPAHAPPISPMAQWQPPSHLAPDTSQPVDSPPSSPDSPGSPIDMTVEADVGEVDPITDAKTASAERRRQKMNLLRYENAQKGVSKLPVRYLDLKSRKIDRDLLRQRQEYTQRRRLFDRLRLKLLQDKAAAATQSASSIHTPSKISFKEDATVKVFRKHDPPSRVQGAEILQTKLSKIGDASAPNIPLSTEIKSSAPHRHRKITLQQGSRGTPHVAKSTRSQQISSTATKAHSGKAAVTEVGAHKVFPQTEAEQIRFMDGDLTELEYKDIVNKYIEKIKAEKKLVEKLKAAATKKLGTVPVDNKKMDYYVRMKLEEKGYVPSYSLTRNELVNNVLLDYHQNKAHYLIELIENSQLSYLQDQIYWDKDTSILSQKFENAEKMGKGLANYKQNSDNWNALSQEEKHIINQVRNDPDLGDYNKLINKYSHTTDPIKKGALLGWVKNAAAQRARITVRDKAVIEHNFEKMFQSDREILLTEETALQIEQTAKTSKEKQLAIQKSHPSSKPTERQRLLAGFKYGEDIVDECIIFKSDPGVSELPKDVIHYWYKKLMEERMLTADAAKLIAEKGDYWQSKTAADPDLAALILKKILVNGGTFSAEERGAIYRKIMSYENAKQVDLMSLDVNQETQLGKYFIRHNSEYVQTIQRPIAGQETLNQLDAYYKKPIRPAIVLYSLEGLSYRKMNPKSSDIAAINMKKSIDSTLSTNTEHKNIRNSLLDDTNLRFNIDDDGTLSTYKKTHGIEVSHKGKHTERLTIEIENAVKRKQIQLSSEVGTSFLIQLDEIGIDWSHKGSIGVNIQKNEGGVIIYLIHDDGSIDQMTSWKDLHEEFKKNVKRFYTEESSTHYATLSEFDITESSKSNNWQVAYQVNLDQLADNDIVNLKGQHLHPNQILALNAAADIKILEHYTGDIPEHSTQLSAATALDISEDVKSFHAHHLGSSEDEEPGGSSCKKRSVSMCKLARRHKVQPKYIITDKKIIQASTKRPSITRSNRAFRVLKQLSMRTKHVTKSHQLKETIGKTLAKQLLTKRKNSPIIAQDLQTKILKPQLQGKGAWRNSIQFYKKGKIVEQKLFGSKGGKAFSVGSLIWSVKSLVEAYQMCSNPDSEEYKQMNCADKQVQRQLAISRNMAIGGMVVSLAYMAGVQLMTKFKPQMMAKISAFKITAVGAALMAPFMIYGIIERFKSGTTMDYVKGAIEILILITSFIPGWGQIISAGLGIVLFIIEIIENWETVAGECYRGVRLGAEYCTGMWCIICSSTFWHITITWTIIENLFSPLGDSDYDNWDYNTKNLYRENPEVLKDSLNYERVFYEEILPVEAKIYFQRGFHGFTWCYLPQSSYGCTVQVLDSKGTNFYTHNYVMHTNKSNHHGVIYGSHGSDFIAGSRDDEYIKGRLMHSDLLWGGPGNDTIYGSIDDDVIFGDFELSTEQILNITWNNDRVYDVYGNADILNIIKYVKDGVDRDKQNTNITDLNIDMIYGHDGNDILFGEEGNDQISGGQGFDVIDGGLGNDVINYHFLVGSGVYINIFTQRSVCMPNIVYGAPHIDFASKLSWKGQSARIPTIPKFVKRSNNDDVNIGLGVPIAFKEKYYPMNRMTMIQIFKQLNDNLQIDQFLHVTLSIENVIGSTHDDVIIGGSLNETLDGLTGSDRLYGLDGNDSIVMDGWCHRILGGNGSDTATIKRKNCKHQRNEFIQTFNQRHYITGGYLMADTSHTQSNNIDQKATIYNEFEKLVGSVCSDVIEGQHQREMILTNGGADLVLANDGNDIIFVFPTGSENTSHIHGGHGNDIASFEQYDIGVKIDITTHTAYISPLFIRKISKVLSIEKIIGTHHDDILKGNLNDNTLIGNSGDDDIYGGHGNDIIKPGTGNNLISGGDGEDTLDYSEAKQCVHVFMHDGLAQTYATLDIFLEIETIIGSNFNDVIKGNDFNNNLYGINGNDVLFTGIGGSNLLNGGDGNDTYVIQGGTNTLSIKGVLENEPGSSLEIIYMTTCINTPKLKEVLGRINDDLQIVCPKNSIAILPNWFKGGQFSDAIIFRGDNTTITPNTTNIQTMVTEKQCLHGNVLDNYLSSNHSNAIISGHNGSDVYALGNNKNVTINNFATDGETDVVQLNIKFEEIKMNAYGDNLTIQCIKQHIELVIVNYFQQEYYRHLEFHTEDVVFQVEFDKVPIAKITYLDLHRAKTCKHLTLHSSEDDTGQVITIIGSNLGDDIDGRNASKLDIKTGDGDNYIRGSQQNDQIVDGLSHDIIIGEGGDDLIKAEFGTNVVKAGNGADQIFTEFDGQIIDGGRGMDTLKLEAGRAYGILIDLSGNQTYGSFGSASIRMKHMEHSISIGNSDVIWGTDEDNKITVGYGRNIVDAGAGNDVIYLYNGADIVFCGDGDDVIITQLGSKKIHGGKGRDTIMFALKNEFEYATLVINIKSGHASFSNEFFTVYIFFSDIEKIVGSFGNDLILDSMDDDYIFGSLGNDTIMSTGGKDMLEGGSGSDWYKISSLLPMEHSVQIMAIINNYDLDQNFDIIEIDNYCEELIVYRAKNDLLIAAEEKLYTSKSDTDKVFQCILGKYNSTTILQNCINGFTTNVTKYWNCLWHMEKNATKDVNLTSCLSHRKKYPVPVSNRSTIIAQSWFLHQDYQHASMICKLNTDGEDVFTNIPENILTKRGNQNYINKPTDTENNYIANCVRKDERMNATEALLACLKIGKDVQAQIDSWFIQSSSLKQMHTTPPVG